jgi:pyruvate/2-oxoglutarate dehydrogenase complex dihydrolipoamide dehydrogenase (E3) component
MPSDQEYDAIVIGSGQGGGPFAGALAQAGRKTALVERLHVGGTCVNEGCTPTKTMVASARVAYLARRGADYGVRTGPVTVDMDAVRARKRAIVDSFRSGSEEATRSTQGLDLIMGDARFSGPKTIEVALNSGGSRVLTAPLIVIDTGTRPSMPPIAGLEKVDALDSTSIMELDAVPDRLLVLGGGYVGLEFGQMFRRFGSEVTLIERGTRLLSREDEDIAASASDILREDGIELVFESQAVQVERTAAGVVRLTLKTAQGEQICEASHLLVAAGRTPNTDSLNLEAAGIHRDARGFIPVDERLQTNVANVYALGDVNGGPAFTHISYDDYRIMKANLLDGGERTSANRLVPYTMFIDPQLARVGMSEREAAAAGRAFRVATMPMSHVARALEVDESRGMMKVLIDTNTDQILGCAILGIEGGEIMAMLEIAMLGGVPASRLRHAVFAHPTLAEALNNLLG